MARASGIRALPVTYNDSLSTITVIMTENFEVSKHSIFYMNTVIFLVSSP